MHSAGTSKKGRFFVTFDVVKDAGLREIASGDSATQLCVLERIINDVVNMFQSCEVGANLHGENLKGVIKSLKA